jgi:hypothetical protein
MKRYIYLILAIAFFSCTKEKECKSVTKMVLNGYDNTVTYPLKDVTMCGGNLVDIRKLNNTFVDIHVDGRTFRITTIIIEK